MTKPRVRLMPIGKCHYGQQAWTRRFLRPITVMAVDKYQGRVGYHMGHILNPVVTRGSVMGWVLVWAIVG